MLAVAISCIATWTTSSPKAQRETMRFIENIYPEETHEDNVQPDDIGWDTLPAEVVAWVQVPGTSIDEPVVQATADNPNAYLYTDALNWGAYGTPYIDCECTLETDFVMIYGHHMSDGSTFADFAKYSDPTFAQAHSKIILYERSGAIHTLDVIAADIVNASSERLDIPKKEAFDQTIQACDTVILTIESPEQLWAFSTCSYQTSNSRTVVYAAEPQVQTDENAQRLI